MAQNESHTFVSSDPAIQSSICARCGKTAEIYLTPLRGVSQHGEAVCLACGEAFLSDLRAQQADQPAILLPLLMHRPLFHADDEVEDGIIFWEGQGWSSDGPFAGA